MKENNDIKSLLLQQQWEASFFQIVEQYTERLFHCAFQLLKDKEEANDALQEAFINIWKNLHKFKGDSAPFSWCYSIVRNQCLSELRKKKNRAQISLDESMAIAGSEELKWDGDELASKLEEVISTLPDKQRLVFELKYYQELSYEEMAELTQTSVGALKASYHHAKQKIGNQLIQALNLP